MNKSYPKRDSLSELDVSKVPDDHPILQLSDLYRNCESKGMPNNLICLESIVQRCHPGLMEYCLLMEPVSGEPFIDFVPRSKGARIPGIETTQISPGELYTDKIKPTLAIERVMEMAASLVLKVPRLSEAMSARSTSLSMRVFRGVFPVWQSDTDKQGVILMIAPPYAQLN